MSSPAPTQADPLAELRPLHLPDTTLWWPPAPGWWILLGLILLGFWFLRRWWQRGQTQRIALRMLGEIEQQSLSGVAFTAAINELLKRYCLATFSREQVAGLTGEQWRTFLDQHSTSSQPKLGKLLQESPYRADLESIDRASVLSEARQWIRTNRSGDTV